MRNIFLSLLFLTSHLCAELEVWQLNSLPLSELTVVKRVPFVRTIYRGDNFYAKVWCEGSYHFANGRNAIFLEAVQQGFFDGVAPLRGVIVNEHNACCGYVTWACKQRLVADSRNVKTGLDRLEELSLDEELLLVIRLYARMRKNSLRTGFILTQDFTGPWNLGITDGKCYLVDLDNVRYIDDFFRQWLYYLDDRFSPYEE